MVKLNIDSQMYTDITCDILCKQCSIDGVAIWGVVCSYSVVVIYILHQVIVRPMLFTISSFNIFFYLILSNAVFCLYLTRATLGLMDFHALLWYVCVCVCVSRLNLQA